MYSLNQYIGSESIIKEYKEFYLRKSLTINDYRDLKEGIISNKIRKYIFDSLIFYFDKYLKKYICSLTNIDKHYLCKLKDNQYSKFFIGVSDDGYITGIPIHSSQLNSIEYILQEKINSYYKDLIGLHVNKGNKQIIINDNTYYGFDKIVNIIKKHIKIRVHILEKDNSLNDQYFKLNETIETILKDEKEYLYEKKLHEEKRDLKISYNEKYSQAFHNLIHSDTMKEFKLYLINYDFPFSDVLEILKERIISPNTVENYLKDGSYVKKSLFPNDSIKDTYYGEKINEFLEHYKNFKNIMLKKNITLQPFIRKNPIKRLKSHLKNISCFSQQFYKNDNILYIVVEIELPIIQDKKVYLGLKEKNDIKIIKRTYEYNMNMPCTETN